MNSGVSYTALAPDTEERFTSLRRELGVSTFGLNQIILRPGQRGRIHRHKTQEEVYFVASGTLQFKLEDEVLDVPAGTVVRIAPAVVRSVWNEGPDDAVLIMCSIKSDDPEGDHETVADFWPE